MLIKIEVVEMLDGFHKIVLTYKGFWIFKFYTKVWKHPRFPHRSEFYRNKALEYGEYLAKQNPKLTYYSNGVWKIDD